MATRAIAVALAVGVVFLPSTTLGQTQSFGSGIVRASDSYGIMPGEVIGQTFVTPTDPNWIFVESIILGGDASGVVVGPLVQMSIHGWDAASKVKTNPYGATTAVMAEGIFTTVFDFGVILAPTANYIFEIAIVPNPQDPSELAVPFRLPSTAYAQGEVVGAQPGDLSFLVNYHTVVPEPSSLVLLAGALIGLAAVGVRRRRVG